MDFNRLTVKAQEAVQAAAERARAAGNPELTAIHLLLALVAESDSVADTLLASAGVDVAALRRAAEEDLAKLPRATGASSRCRSPASASAPCSTAPRWRRRRSPTSTSRPSTC